MTTTYNWATFQQHTVSDRGKERLISQQTIVGGLFVDCYLGRTWKAVSLLNRLGRGLSSVVGLRSSHKMSQLGGILVLHGSSLSNRKRTSSTPHSLCVPCESSATITFDWPFSWKLLMRLLIFVVRIQEVPIKQMYRWRSLGGRRSEDIFLIWIFWAEFEKPLNADDLPPLLSSSSSTLFDFLSSPMPRKWLNLNRFIMNKS